MFSWTPENVAELPGLVAQNLSARQIGDALGTSRNSVISKCTRMGLQLNGARPACKPRACRPKREKGVRVFKPRSVSFTPKATPMPVEPLNIPLVDLEPHHCREVVSQDGFIAAFCGHDKKEGSSYCPFHASVNETRSLPPKRPGLFRFGNRAA